MWLFFALLSAVFAAFTAVLAKIGIDGVNGTLATAIRTAVVLVMAWGISHACGAGDFRNQSEELAVSHSVGACDGSFLALLLSRAATRARQSGRAD